MKSRVEVIYKTQLKSIHDTNPAIQARIETKRLQELLRVATNEKKIVQKELQEAKNRFQHAQDIEYTMARDLQTAQFQLKVAVTELNSKVDTNDDMEHETQRCFSNDCNGWIVNNKNCTICKKSSCFKCMTMTDDTKNVHTCNTDDLKNAEYIRKNSVKCPMCSARISKMNGCNDMFCVICKTAFNYATLQIHPKGNSNPHFYTWLRSIGIENPRSVRTIDGDNFTFFHIKNRPLFKSLPPVTKAWVRKNFNKYLPFFTTRIAIPNIQETLVHLRMDFIEDTITENEFKTKIADAFTQYEMKMALRHLEEDAKSLYRRSINECFNANDADAFMATADTLDKQYDVIVKNMQEVRKKKVSLKW